jgi:hypothetical protein
MHVHSKELKKLSHTHTYIFGEISFPQKHYSRAAAAAVPSFCIGFDFTVCPVEYHTISSICPTFGRHEFVALLLIPQWKPTFSVVEIVLLLLLT